MLRIDLLPAEFGDAIWIEYGAAGTPHRILIDCGTKAVFQSLRTRILALPVEQRHFELFVVTHVDIDHIGGAIDLLRESKALKVTFGEIWFNGYAHLTAGGTVPRSGASDVLGPLQGEELTNLIVACGGQKWNRSTRGGALVVPDEGPLAPLASLPGGMQVTLLSPTQTQLVTLRPVWEAACRKAGIAPGAATASDDDLIEEAEGPAEDDDLLGDPDVEQLAARPFKPDRAKPNGSSIALLAEYGGRRVLLAGDAHAGTLTSSLLRLPGHLTGPVQLDAVKMSHHGSGGNTSREFVEAVQCGHWLVSTNGKQFKHPDAEAIARVIRYGSRDSSLHFNYRTAFNEVWATSKLQAAYGYKTHFPDSNSAGIRLEWTT